MSAAIFREVSVEVGLDEVSDPEAVRDRVARRLGVPSADLPALTLRKRSLDARRGRIRYRLLFEIGRAKCPEERLPRAVEGPVRAVIVGDGPAGMFCAYELARAGIACVVVDRGKPVQPRRRDLKGLNRHGRVDADSNYCFGEGGAGTYSDGKLYTRSHKRGDVRDVIETLARHGAPGAIRTDARPHIGSNRLPKVVESLRAELEASGVIFRFGARVTDLVVSESAPRRARGVVLHDGSEIEADSVVLATGHSARDVYDMLERAGAVLEPKPFAVGVRVEHPQALIDRIQYGRAAGHPALPSAAYRVAATVHRHGAYSFCMCPGGWIVPASTEPGALVVNGMSLSKRNSPHANSGLVLGLEPADVARTGRVGWRGAVALQRALEECAFEAGGGSLRAPATRVTDFIGGRASTTVSRSSYIPGLTATDVGEVLDSTGLPLTDWLKPAIREFERKMKGFITEEAVLVGVESRTSSPVRVVRDPQTLQVPTLRGLYPVGEGAGYAGGIMSAALDGIRAARAIAMNASTLRSSA